MIFGANSEPAIKAVVGHPRERWLDRRVPKRDQLRSSAPMGATENANKSSERPIRALKHSLDNFTRIVGTRESSIMAWIGERCAWVMLRCQANRMGSLRIVDRVAVNTMALWFGAEQFRA